eukprot:610168-Rhodomonas_salina.3
MPALSSPKSLNLRARDCRLCCTTWRYLHRISSIPDTASLGGQSVHLVRSHKSKADGLHALRARPFTAIMTARPSRPPARRLRG